MAQWKVALLSGPLIQADETPLQVLNEPGRSNTTKSTMRNDKGYCQMDGFAMRVVSPKPFIRRRSAACSAWLDGTPSAKQKKPVTHAMNFTMQTRDDARRGVRSRYDGHGSSKLDPAIPF